MKSGMRIKGTMTVPRQVRLKMIQRLKAELAAQDTKVMEELTTVADVADLLEEAIADKPTVNREEAEANADLITQREEYGSAVDTMYDFLETLNTMEPILKEYRVADDLRKIYDKLRGHLTLYYDGISDARSNWRSRKKPINEIAAMIEEADLNLQLGLQHLSRNVYRVLHQMKQGKVS